MLVTKLRRAIALWLLLAASVGTTFAQRAERPTPQPSRPDGGISYLFVSPNTREGLSRAEALRGLDSAEEAELITGARGLTRCLGLKAVIARALGNWADGAEHIALIKTTADEATVRYVDARLGMRARQKSVLYFRVHEGGASKMHVLVAESGGRGLPAITEVLDRSGIPYRTLIPGPRRVVIYAVDLKDELGASVAGAARRLGARHQALRGTGAFIGDDEDRARAQEVYREIVSGYEASSPRVAGVCGGAEPRTMVKKAVPHDRARPGARQSASDRR